MDQQQIIDLVNQFRHNDGLPTLQLNEHLQNAATDKNNDMIQQQYFSHRTPEKSQDISAFVPEDYDYYAIGENLAYGFQTPEELVSAWTHSESHLSNILYRFYTDTGVAAESVNGKYLVTHVFGITQEEYLEKSVEYEQETLDNTKEALYATAFISSLMFIMVLAVLIRRRFQNK